jgi:hypothetical protein
LTQKGREMAHVFYVATSGSDAWSGALPEPTADGTDGPFASFQRAVEAARAVGQDVERRVVLRGGAYYDVALALDDRDSGLTIEAAAGEEPVLYGGRPVEGWVQEDGFWTASLPEVARGDWDFRMLQVNGRMCPRARLPKEGTFVHNSVFEVRWMTSTGGGWQREPTQEELTTMEYREGDLGPWLDVNNAEVTVYHSWDDSMVGVKAIDTERRVLTFSSPCGHPPGSFPRLAHAHTYVVWNVREGMHEPGQWYLDRTAGKVVYWPLPGEEIDRVEAIAPTTERVVDIAGREGAIVSDLTLRGLTLGVTNTPLIAASFGAAFLDGAITGQDPLVNCTFEGLAIQNVAGHGIKITDRVKFPPLAPDMDKSRPSPNQGIQILACEMNTTGAGGIKLVAQDSVIRDNLVHQVGLMYPAAIGVWFTGDRNMILHNEISETSYSGMAGHFGRGIRVEHNEFRHVMQVLDDGAAIYVFYVVDLVMRGNVACDIAAGPGGRHAYYFDELSEDCAAVGNLAVNVPSSSQNHWGRNNRIENNVFISDGDVYLHFPRSKGYTVARNVICARGAIQFRNVDAVTCFDHNICFSGANRLEGIRYKEGLYREQETLAMQPTDDTLNEDPLFVDPERGDYRFRPGSPALRLGIEPIDVSEAGRTGR